MPECPEITIMANQLNDLLKNKFIQSIDLISGPYLNSKNTNYVQLRNHILSMMTIIKNPNKAIMITSVHKKGKFIYFPLAIVSKDGSKLKKSNDICLGSSLGLTGHWVSVSDENLFSSENDTSFENSHNHIVIRYSDKPKPKPEDIKKIYYNDISAQGKFYAETMKWLKIKLNDLGPDVLSSGFTYDKFKEKMSIKRIQNKPIYMSLVDQSIISGIGNYLRADIMYIAQIECKINPLSNVKDLSEQQLKCLWKSIITVSNNSLRQHGTTSPAYVDIYLNPGKYEPIIYGKNIAPNGSKIRTLIDPKKRKFHHIQTS